MQTAAIAVSGSPDRYRAQKEGIEHKRKGSSSPGRFKAAQRGAGGPGRPRARERGLGGVGGFSAAEARLAHSGAVEGT